MPNKVSIQTIKETANRYDTKEAANNFSSGRHQNSHRTSRMNKEFNIIYHFIKSNLFQSKIALDIACSGGRYTKMLLEEDFKTYGIDLACNPLIHAKINLNKSIFTRSSATDLPFKENIFDLVICVELIHHLDDELLSSLLININKSLKPGGWLILDVRNSLNPVLWYSYKKRDGNNFPLRTRNPFKISKLMKKHGFKIQHSKGLFFPIDIFAPYVILFAKKEDKNGN